MSIERALLREKTSDEALLAWDEAGRGGYGSEWQGKENVFDGDVDIGAPLRLRRSRHGTSSSRQLGKATRREGDGFGGVKGQQETLHQTVLS